MKTVILATTLMVAFAGAPRMAQAQGNPLVGKWQIEFERGRRMENGVVTPIMGTGTISFASSGDSLVATLLPGPRADGSAAPPASFGGRMTAEGAVFVQKAKATLNMNGEERTEEITMTWTFRASGDTLTGTLVRVLPMMPEEPAPSPVKGTRMTG